MISLGYAAINKTLRDINIYTNRTITLKKIKGLEQLEQLALKNIADLKTIIEWNEEHGIRFYRLSSALFPHLDNIKLDNQLNYSVEFAKDKLKEIGEFCRKNSHRITMHPPQFLQLGSPNETVVTNSIVSLTQHVNILEAMGLTPEMGTCLILHGGGTYGNKQTAIERWKNIYKNLNHRIRQYIVLENDEWNYSVADLLPICEELNIPFCLDIFHNSISNDRIKITKSLIRRVFNTWRVSEPKMHYSQQDPTLRKGAHSKTVTKIPKWLLLLPQTMKINRLDIMLEVKDKELSVLKIYNKFFHKTFVKGKLIYVLNVF
ncbi:MAG: putative UV-damage endonuclease [Hyperionvirus sp.]|uniref:Putative UV-damage endonuclease n=1 Tax=Hyperionvirus sp. TaxID=2487770 RepID=A0A3G5A9F3_9VIRU|nr:MAG: putative UV-damage endonuclease [Hyperionvirus sp.]